MAFKEVPVGEWADYDPVVNDAWLGRVEGIIRQTMPEVPDDMDLVTFIQPPKIAPNKDGIEQPWPEMAIFAVVSDNPKHKTFRVMTTGTTKMIDWLDAKKEYQHYAGGKDPLLTIFRGLVTQHLTTVKNLAEMN